MNPPVFAALNVPAVNALVGTRIFGNGIAPQDATRPYVVWQIVGGGPVNNLSEDPDMDDARVRVTTYSDETHGTAAARALKLTVMVSLEAVTHVVFGPVDDYEAETKMLLSVMDAEFWDPR